MDAPTTATGPQLQAQFDTEAAHLTACALRQVVRTMPRSERIGAALFAVAFPALLFGAALVLA
jgi:hypothetical protein